jgi:hypothetical protein
MFSVRHKTRQHRKHWPHQETGPYEKGNDSQDGKINPFPDVNFFPVFHNSTKDSYAQQDGQQCKDNSDYNL